MKMISGILAIAALLACLFAPIGYFMGWLAAGTFKSIFLVASVVWFVFAWLWAREKGDAPGESEGALSALLGVEHE